MLLERSLVFLCTTFSIQPGVTSFCPCCAPFAPDFLVTALHVQGSACPWPGAAWWYSGGCWGTDRTPQARCLPRLRFPSEDASLAEQTLTRLEAVRPPGAAAGPPGARAWMTGCQYGVGGSFKEPLFFQIKTFKHLNPKARSAGSF